MRFELVEIRDSGNWEALEGILLEGVPAMYGLAEGGGQGFRREFLESSLEKPDGLLLYGRESSATDPAAVLFAGPHHDPFLDLKTTRIYLLYTRRSFRRLGLAGALLARAEDLLKERGHESLWAPARHNEDAIISMGERRGYVRETEWMVKEL